MDWSNERYVRLFTRDTRTWLLCGWKGQAVLCFFLRKCDRSGIMSGVHDAGDLSVMFGNGIPVEYVETGLESLLKHGVLVDGCNGLMMPNYIEAQETASSDAQRKRDERERNRRLNAESVTKRDTESQNVTISHAESRAVTPSHAESLRTVPNCAVPSVPSHTVLFSFARSDCEAQLLQAGASAAVIAAMKERYTDRLEKLSSKAATSLLVALSDGMFSGINVPCEIHKAAMWEIANPKKRKTAQGLSRYLLGWMTRQQDKAGANTPPQQPEQPAYIPGYLSRPHASLLKQESKQ